MFSAFVRWHFAVVRFAHFNVIYGSATKTSTDIIGVNTIIDITDINLFVNVTNICSNKTEHSRWNRIFRCSLEMRFRVLYCVVIVQVLRGNPLFRN
jgi:hypothetical protein